MSKIKVNEIESNNRDVVLASNGTGTVKVKGVGGADGTLKLTSSNGTNGVKLKSPPHSATQSYTLILPNNNIEADKFLKVASITGSGNNAVGQLQYATPTTVDTSNLNGTDFTSGTVPSARIPSGFPSAASGAALKLITQSIVTNSSYIDFTGLDDDSTYLLIGKSFYLSGTSYIQLWRLDANGNNDFTSTNFKTTRWYSPAGNNWATSDKINWYNGFNARRHGWMATFTTNANNGHFFFTSITPGEYSRGEMYARYQGSSYLTGIRLGPSSGYFSNNGAANRNEVLLYKLLES